MPQTAHLANILQASQSVNHTAGAEKQERLKKCVCHQVEPSGSVRAGATCQKHVAEMTDCGIGENTLDVGLNQTDRRGKDRRKRTNDGYDKKRTRSMVIDGR